MTEAESEEDLRLAVDVARAFAESGLPLSEDFTKGPYLYDVRKLRIFGVPCPHLATD